MENKKICENSIREKCLYISRYWHLVSQVDYEDNSGVITTKLYQHVLQVAVITMRNGEYLSLMFTTGEGLKGEKSFSLNTRGEQNA